MSTEFNSTVETGPQLSGPFEVGNAPSSPPEQAQPIHRRAISESMLMEAIENELSIRLLGPGDQLPTERALADAIGVTRNAIRRSLARLEAQGRISRHVGRGTFLAGSTSAPTGRNDTSPAEIMAVRAVFEPELVALASLSATPNDLREMRRCLDGGDRSDTQPEFEAWDSALHCSFAAASHNGLLIAVADLIENARQDPAWGTLKQRSSSPELRQRYRNEHRAIVEALTLRDPQRARAAARQHLMTVRTALFGTT